MSTTAPDDRITSYSPVTATKEFPALFPVFDNSDLIVVHNGVTRTDFTVTATYIAGVSNNAKAVFATGITGDVKVVGSRASRRPKRFVDGSPLPTRDQNLAFDVLQAEVQEARRDIARAVKVDFGEAPYRVAGQIRDGYLVQGGPDNSLEEGPAYSDLEAMSAAAVAAAAQAQAIIDNATANIVNSFSDDLVGWIAAYRRSVAKEIDLLPYIANPNDADANTAIIQALINEIHVGWLINGRGGVIYLPANLQIKLGASTLSETYYNGSSPVAANTACLIVKPGVSIVGPGRYSGARLHCDDRGKTVLYLLEPDQVVLKGFRISSVWTYGLSGAGHGVFTLKKAIGIDTGAIANRVIFDDLWVNNVASYGLSFQNGMPQGCQVSNIDIEYTGADGIDLKARYQTVKAYGNKAYNIRVRNHGSRVTGSAGIDTRGAWHLDNIDVAEFGALNAANGYVGIRLRTKTDPLLGEPDGSKSTISNFLVDASSAISTDVDGVQCGSDDATISNGYINNAVNGVAVFGNAVGDANRVTVSNVHTVDCTQYGFKTTVGAVNTTFIGCSSKGSGLAGIRNEGVNTLILGHQTASETFKSTATSANATEQVVGGLTGNSTIGLSLTVGWDTNAVQTLLSVNGAAGSARRVNITTASVSRWFLQGNAAAETGSNVGTDFEIVARSDAGANLGAALALTRATLGIKAFGAYSATTANAANVNVASDGTLARSTSSERYKTDIEPMSEEWAEKVYDLEPIWYRSLCDADPEGWSYWGLSAEAVAAIDPRLVHWRTHERVAREIETEEGPDTAYETVPLDTPIAEGVAYDRLVCHLIVAAKKEREERLDIERRLEALAAKVATLGPA